MVFMHPGLTARGFLTVGMASKPMPASVRYFKSMFINAVKGKMKG
jgi:hypothetical protein